MKQENTHPPHFLKKINPPENLKSGGGGGFSQVKRITFKKILEKSGSWNPMRLYQAWQSLKWSRLHEQFLAKWQWSIDEGQRYRQQRQLDLANQTVRVHLQTCIEFPSGQKMELKAVEADIPFPYFDEVKIESKKS